MSKSSDLAALPAGDLIHLFRTRQASPVEATQAALDRIGTLNARYNAFCLVDGESALASARESESRWAKGKPLSAIDGIATSIKDIILTKGWPTLRGSRTTDPDAAMG